MCAFGLGWNKFHNSIFILKLVIRFNFDLDSIPIHLDMYQVQYMSIFLKVNKSQLMLETVKEEYNI